MPEAFDQWVERNFKGIEMGTGRFLFDLDNGTSVAVAISLDGGRDIKIDAIDLRGISGDHVISDLLREISIRTLRAAIYRVLRNDDSTSLVGVFALDARAALYRGSGREPPEDFVLAEKRAGAAIQNLKDTPHRGRRPTTPDAHFRDVAIALIRAHERDPFRPVTALAIDLNHPRGTVADWVRKARKIGWLAKTQRGKTSVGPGPRLIEYRQREGAES